MYREKKTRIYSTSLVPLHLKKCCLKIEMISPWTPVHRESSWNRFQLAQVPHDKDPRRLSRPSSRTLQFLDSSYLSIYLSIYLSYPILQYPILSYPTVSYPILSIYLSILSYLILSYPIHPSIYLSMSMYNIYYNTLNIWIGLRKFETGNQRRCTSRTRATASEPPNMSLHQSTSSALIACDLRQLLGTYSLTLGSTCL